VKKGGDEQNSETRELIEELVKSALKKRVELSKKNYLEKERIERLKVAVSELLSRGIKVVVFELPVHPEICNHENAVKLRNLLKNEFKSLDVLYVEPGDCSDYQTSDGMHLYKDSAKKFSGYLLEKARQGNAHLF